MRKKIIKYSIMTISLFSLSCNKENRCDCFKSTGDITSESRNISDFKKIILEDNINLYITPDTIYSLTIEAGAHLLKSIKTEVTDSCLILKNENKCNWVRNYKDKIK
jgi:hypothetical protein